MAKKIRLHVLKKHDLENDDSLVRDLEMTVDGAIRNPLLIVQFWRDVQMYGVDEAILYVKNDGHGDAESIATEWAKLRQRLK